MRMKDQTFSTDSFQLASYLLSESCHLLSVDKSNPQRLAFVFEDDERRKTLTSEFLSYKAVIEPHRYYSAQRDLKQMIYQSKSKGGNE